MSSSFKNFLTLFILFFSALFTQAQVNDAGLWASINLEKSFNKKFTVALSEELRFNENISELGTFFTEVSAEYKFWKFLYVSAGYRFINKKSLDDSYSKRHRFLVNLNLKKKFNNFNTSLRIRYQSQFSDIESSDDASVPDNYIRTKLTGKYNSAKRIVPYITAESFFHLNNPEGVLIDNLRFSAGAEYEFSKRSMFDLGYLIDKEIMVNDPWTSYIIAVSWTYKL